MRIKTGKGTTISLIAVIDIYIILIATFLPGFAVAPILGKLNSVFPHASDLEIQLLTSIPSATIIPFIIIGGQIASKVNNILLLNIGFIIFSLAGAAMMFGDNILWIIIFNVLLGIGAGIIIPLSATLMANIFSGTARVRQFGYSSAVSNIALMFVMIFSGYIAKVNWHLSFSIYLLALVPLALSPFLSKYVKEPVKEVASNNKSVINLSLYKEINIPRILKYMCYHGIANFMAMCISVNLPFLMEQYHHGSGVTSDLMSIIYISGMLPGLFLSPLSRIMGKYIYELCMLMIAVGFGIILLSKSLIVIAAGIFVMGSFYGIVLPFIYEKTADVASPRAMTIAYAWSIVIDYIAIFVYPFIVSGLQEMLKITDQTFAFYFNMILALATAIIIFIRRFFIERRTHSRA